MYGPVISQEYYSLPAEAKEIPSNSISFHVGAMYGRSVYNDRVLQRYSAGVGIGISPEWMISSSLTFSDLHDEKFIFESVRLTSKYRLITSKTKWSQFRLSAFGTVAYSRNHLDYNEINLAGDHSGVQAGLLASHMWKRWAFSGSASLIEMFSKSRWEKDLPQQYAYEAFNYSVSAGVNIFPLNNKKHSLAKVNFLAQLIGSSNLDWKYEKYYVDLAPAIQLILNRKVRFYLQHRFQIKSDIFRLQRNSWVISYEFPLFSDIKKNI